MKRLAYTVSAEFASASSFPNAYLGRLALAFYSGQLIGALFLDHAFTIRLFCAFYSSIVYVGLQLAASEECQGERTFL